MKRTILPLLLLSLAWLPLAAQQQNTTPYAQRLLEQCIAALRAMDNYRAEFTYADGGTVQKGALYVKGDRFRLETDLFTLVSDGVYSYTIDDQEKEVAVQKANETATGGLGPVQKMLEKFAAAFTPRTDRLQAHVQTLRLIPNDAANPARYILIGVDTSTRLPLWIEQEEKNGTRTRVDLTKIIPGGAKDDALYRFDAEKYKKQGYYIARP